jgi:DNA-binding GntR family transcriptional regulator
MRNSTEEEADILKLKPGAGVVRVRRLYRKGSSGVMMEEIIMRGEEFGDFDRNLASAPDPLALILAESATEIGRCVESISAVPAPERVAKALGAADGTPMLHCRRLLEDDEGKPLGALDRWILADAAVCTMVLN